jgi:hypothetical protein
VTVRGEGEAGAVIDEHGLRVKEIEAGAGGPPADGSGQRQGPRLFKISVPLSEDRLTAFRAAFAERG